MEESSKKRPLAGSSSPPRKRAPVSSPPPPQQPQQPPPQQEERRLFRLWLEASRLAAAAAVAKQASKEEDDAGRKRRRAAHDAYLDAVKEATQGKRLAYDPNSRRFVEHAPALDPPCSSRLYFQYHPVASDDNAAGASSLPAPPTLHRRYELRVINGDTRQRGHRATIDLLERHLVRRYRGGARPRRLGLLTLRPSGEVAIEAGALAAEGVELKVYDLTAPPFAAADGDETALGRAFNRACLQAVHTDGCDLLLAWRGARLTLPGDIDASFSPAYPVLYAEGLLLTPLQLLQADGCDREARDVVQSLLDRTSGLLGAVVLDKEARLPYVRFEDQQQQTPGRGLASEAGLTGIEAHPRALRITGELGVRRYVPAFRHGWLSTDTAILLATAIRAFRPRRVLELGSWLGLSSSFILREGWESIERFTTVDHFKNTAVSNTTRMPDGVSPLDKLYFHHLRFETFYSNLESHVFQQPQSQPQPQPPKTPEVIMLRANIHAAVQLMHGQGEAVDLVFVDAEKDTRRLVSLLQAIHARYPQAVIVGDDLAFAGVQRALVELALPEDRLVRRTEAYIVLPEASPVAKAAVLAAMAQEVEPRLAVPAFQQEVVALIEAGRIDEAAALAEEHGLGLGDELYSPGKSVLHDVCRRRDPAALAFLERYLEEDLGRQLDAEDGVGTPLARVPVNNIGLTPFDYLTDAINF